MEETKKKRSGSVWLAVAFISLMLLIVGAIGLLAGKMKDDEVTERIPLNERDKVIGYTYLILGYIGAFILAPLIRVKRIEDQRQAEKHIYLAIGALLALVTAVIVWIEYAMFHSNEVSFSSFVAAEIFGGIIIVVCLALITNIVEELFNPSEMPQQEAKLA